MSSPRCHSASACAGTIGVATAAIRHRESTRLRDHFLSWPVAFLIASLFPSLQPDEETVHVLHEMCICVSVYLCLVRARVLVLGTWSSSVLNCVLARDWQEGAGWRVAGASGRPTAEQMDARQTRVLALTQVPCRWRKYSSTGKSGAGDKSRLEKNSAAHESQAGRRSGGVRWD